MAETRTYEEMLRLLENGSVSRTTGSTKMNASSSRSHAIFTVILVGASHTVQQVDPRGLTAHTVQVEPGVIPLCFQALSGTFSS